MRHSARLSGLVFLALSALAVSSARASDPADVTYWQSVQNSKNPAEYKAYLNAFPKGAFAGLAQERIKELSGGTAKAAAPQPPKANVVGKGIITIAPANPQVGDKIILTFAKFPHVGDTYDYIVVVPAGTPDNSTQVGLSQFYLNDQQVNDPSGTPVGPFAPGNYEVRWLTRLYNNKNLYQVGARTAFTISD